MHLYRWNVARRSPGSRPRGHLGPVLYPRVCQCWLQPRHACSSQPPPRFLHIDNDQRAVRPIFKNGHWPSLRAPRYQLQATEAIPAFSTSHSQRAWWFPSAWVSHNTGLAALFDRGPTALRGDPWPPDVEHWRHFQSPKCRSASRSIAGRLRVGRRPVALPLRSSARLRLGRVVTGVWVEHHRGPTRRPYAGECRAPGRTVEVVPRSA